MIVEVFHNGVLVATVTIPRSHTRTEEALEYAWRWTNNTAEGSWSRPDNVDYNPQVKVEVPLPKHDGVEYGLRSSMVGDLFKLGKRHFVVGTFGFKEIGNNETAQTQG
jgi:hypothetical protein